MLFTFILVISSVAYTSAKTCGPGTYISGSSCVSCSPGTYQDQSNHDSCTSASAGYYAAGTGATSQTQCAAGSYSSSSGASSCTKCAAGTYQSQTGSTSCTTAQAGWYVGSAGATSETVCGIGLYSSSGATKCASCPPGYYCGSQNTNNPTLCPPGHYSAGGAGQQCTECAKGTFTSIYGATSCCTCCAGTYVDQTGSPWCYPCTPAGYSSPGSTSSSQCTGNSGGSSICIMSGDTCPNTGASLPTGNKRHLARGLWCPRGQKNCPVYGINAKGKGYLRSYECVNVASDLESCGGCVGIDSPAGELTEDGGRDCSTIPNIDAVSCNRGSCVIESCRAGYNVSASGQTCSPTLLDFRLQ